MGSDVQMLKDGAQLNCSSGTIRVLKFIGKGAQGQVYKVEMNGKEYALKYYFPENCKQSFKKNLKYIIDNPVESTRFLWPLYFVDNGSQFGYLMDLKKDSFVELLDILNGNVNTTIQKLLIACINISEAYHDLYSMGFTYKDISLGNICINPQTGEAIILDNDNVTANLEPSAVCGTPGFMAPELVSGLIKTPSRFTDLHSLAVLLFYMIMGNHPLEGNLQGKQVIDFNTEEEFNRFIYGTKTARFIFADENNLDRFIDTSDDSHIGTKGNWLGYPKAVRNLFRRSFVDGINDAYARPDSEEWLECLQKTLGKFFYCPTCDEPLFLNKKLLSSDQRRIHCPNCNNDVLLPVLRTHNGQYIVINNGDYLYAGYFNITGETKTKVILEARYYDGKLQLINKSNYCIICGNKEIRFNETSDVISQAEDIVVNGVCHKIVI